MNFKKYITPDYLFNINALASPRLDRLFLLFGAVAVVLSVVMKVSAVLAPNPVDKKYRGKFFSLLLTVGLWEVLWYAFSFENIRFFGSHFVALLGLLIGLVWLIVILVNMAGHYKTGRQEWEKQQVRLKYLPK